MKFQIEKVRYNLENSSRVSPIPFEEYKIGLENSTLSIQYVQILY